MKVTKEENVYSLEFENSCDLNSFVHYLSGIIQDEALLATFQNEDGSVVVPVDSVEPDGEKRIKYCGQLTYIDGSGSARVKRFAPRETEKEVYNDIEKFINELGSYRIVKKVVEKCTVQSINEYLEETGLF